MPKVTSSQSKRRRDSGPLDTHHGNFTTPNLGVFEWKCVQCQCPEHLTPVKRIGPDGLRSICNACYIRGRAQKERGMRGSARPGSLNATQLPTSTSFALLGSQTQYFVPQLTSYYQNFYANGGVVGGDGAQQIASHAGNIGHDLLNSGFTLEPSQLYSAGNEALYGAHAGHLFDSQTSASMFETPPNAIYAPTQPSTTLYDTQSSTAPTYDTGGNRLAPQQDFKQGEKGQGNNDFPPFIAVDESTSSSRTTSRSESPVRKFSHPHRRSQQQSSKSKFQHELGSATTSLSPSPYGSGLQKGMPNALEASDEMFGWASPEILSTGSSPMGSDPDNLATKPRARSGQRLSNSAASEPNGSHLKSRGAGLLM